MAWHRSWSLDMLASVGRSFRIQQPIEVADVGVDRANGETRATYHLGDVAHRVDGQRTVISPGWRSRSATVRRPSVSRMLST